MAREVPRNIRLSLTVIEMVQPYVHLTSPAGAVTGGSGTPSNWMQAVNCTYDAASGEPPRSPGRRCMGVGI